jgi:hypothetical protein
MNISLPIRNKLCTVTAVNSTVIHTAIFVVWVVKQSRASLYVYNINFVQQGRLVAKLTLHT